MSGPIEPEQLGTTLMHEHTGSIVPGAFYTGGDMDAGSSIVESALSVLRDHHVGAMVDLSGRNGISHTADRGLRRRLAERLGIHLIDGFALYKDPWLSNEIDRLNQPLAAYLVESVTSGVGDVRAGLFGEIGTSLNEITPNEELQLEAAAQAQIETGVAISTHCTLGTMALEQAQILESAGADLSRVVLGHLDLRPSVDYLTRVLDQGVNIAFDTFGKEWFDYQAPGKLGPEGGGVKHTYHRPDRDRVSVLADLCQMGHDDHIVLSCDMSGIEAWMNPETHGKYGYAYLFQVVIPQLREAGVSEKSIDRMLVTNPARILAVS